MSKIVSSEKSYGLARRDCRIVSYLSKIAKAEKKTGACSQFSRRILPSTKLGNKLKNSPGAIGKRSITQVGFGNHIIQQSIDRETGDGLDARLAGDVLAVGNNRMDRYEILVGDLPVSQAPGDGNEDLALALRKLIAFRLCRRTRLLESLPKFVMHPSR